MKTDTKSTVLLKHHLKALKLPTIHAECEKVASRCAQDNIDHLGFLLQLCELELIERERKAAERRLKMARFPAHKLLDEFDFQARPSINKPAAQVIAAPESTVWNSCSVKTCGTIPDGCKATLDCGSCPAGQTCGATLHHCVMSKYRCRS